MYDPEDALSPPNNIYLVSIDLDHISILTPGHAEQDIVLSSNEDILLTFSWVNNKSLLYIYIVFRQLLADKDFYSDKYIN